MQASNAETWAGASIDILHLWGIPTLGVYEIDTIGHPPYCGIS
jgi:hypothetical protein